MADVLIFQHTVFGRIRAVELDNKIYFVGVDVARTLEYANPSKAVLDHCKGISKLGIPSSGGIQETNVIPEGDVYRLVLKAAEQSKNAVIREKAEQFERWIFDEVIPSIRKHGVYMSPEKIEEVLLNPDTIIKIATQLKEEREARMRLQAKVEADKPKVLFAEAVEVSQTTILIRELALLLKQNGLDVGEKRLYKRLREMGYLVRREGTDRNMPTQRAMELGLFEVKETPIVHSDGRVTVSKTPKVTGKGQVYFVNLFRRKLNKQVNPNDLNQISFVGGEGSFDRPTR
ncbi:phage antirepressor [Alicyclobacillus tolerans]|uniref:phage antirepressor n=1 Tax=Alicyclobacillus tolerans TaxID=90970 RepID=UPI003B7CB027